MGKINPKWRARSHRRRRIRKQLSGSREMPRLAVFKSNAHVYAQLIDDTRGYTVAAASTMNKDLRSTPATVEGAKQVGASIAEKARAAGVQKVVFDRGGFRYHGVVKSLANAAREGGLEF